MKINKKGILLFLLSTLLVGCDETEAQAPIPHDHDPGHLLDTDPKSDKPKVEDCTNTLDDDGNGLTDCDDPACAKAKHCLTVTAEDCHNHVDDDRNGLTDCDDPACATDEACQMSDIELVEICGNGIDDDHNGVADCNDPECFDFDACIIKYEICGNGVDDDENGKTDCDDPACATFVACHAADGDAIERDVDGVMMLPLTLKPYTTLNRSMRPHIGSRNYSEDDVNELIRNRNSILNVTQVTEYEKYGLGVELLPGEPWVEKSDLVVGNTRHTDKAKSLMWIWQISDPQLIDEESPCRLEGLTIFPYSHASAFRPQDHLSTHMMDVHIQTGMRLSDLSSRPFDFILVTGDISDNAQFNEQKWFFSMIGGGVTNPDSGVDDDPVPGPNNDFADPFYSRGVGDIPWYPAIGNHDLLYMGFSAVNDEINNACQGDHVVDLFKYISDAFPIIAGHENRDGWRNGFRDASKPDAPIVTDTKVTTPADPERRQLTKIETLENFYNAPGKPVGHGLSKDIIATGWGYYSTYPMPGKPIRLISLDLNSGEMSEAMMQEEQFNWMKNELKDAEAKDELVIIQSHHDAQHLKGTVSESRFADEIASHPNVLLHITGHGHQNTATLHKSSTFNLDHQGYWEVMLASSVDFPSQTRVFEFVWEPGTTQISIYITNIDANAPAGSFVYDAIRMAAARLFFGTQNRIGSDPRLNWDSEKSARNQILNLQISEKLAQKLAQYDWSDTIESLETLKTLEYHDNR